MDRHEPSPSREWVLARNNVTVTGTGDRTMIFAHGFGCDQHMWRFVSPAFEADHRVVLFDYAGCGQSDLASFDPHRYGSLHGYAQDVLDVCAALDVRDAIFVGHSVSSMIGVLAAARQPSCFSELVMIAPSPRYLDDPPDYVGGFSRDDIEELFSVMDHNYIGWARTLAPVVMGNAHQPELTAELEQSFCSTDPTVARTFAQATFFGDNRADLASVSVPTLILQVSDDAIAPVSVGHYLHERIAASTLTILDAQGHCPHLSHADETIRAMRGFLHRDRAA
jgi:sigma-B regulation protein RsbQ